MKHTRHDPTEALRAWDEYEFELDVAKLNVKIFADGSHYITFDPLSDSTHLALVQQPAFLNPKGIEVRVEELA